MRNDNTVWLIDEGQTGHLVQSLGIIRALERLGFYLNVKKISCKFELRGLYRPVARAIFSRLDGQHAVRFAKRMTPFSEPSGPAPSFIVSSGGQSAFVSRALALQTGAPNVFIGDPKPFPFSWFSAVLSPVPLPQGEAIPTGVFPNLMTPEYCAMQAQRYWNGAPPSRCWALLIGGARRRDHLYDVEDWQDIAAGINTLAERYGIRWLVSTSPRTGSDAEAVLEDNIAPSAVEELVLFGREPKHVALFFVGAAQRVFVTRDSLTMVSEAILSGLPVTGLLPKRVELGQNHFMAVVFGDYARRYQYSEMACSELSNFVGAANEPVLTNQTPADELHEAAITLARQLRLGEAQ